jgi:hypothetical protein
MAATDFQQLRATLQNQRRELGAKQQGLLLTGETRKRLADRRARLLRRIDPNNEADQKRLRDLDERIAKAEDEVATLRREHARLDAALADTLTTFVPLTDPRKQAGELDGGLPILLMPVRIETRFQRLADDRRELWVRVYPDECMVHTFEPSLSDAEVRQVRTYFAELWRAGDLETQRRSAWRNLAASHGTGRALWIVSQYRPLNEADQPQRNPDTVILAIVTDAPLAAAEAAAADAFWTAVWRAGDDGAAAAQAKEDLIQAVGEERAETIGTDYRPFNLADPPPAGVSRAAAQVIVATLRFPTEDETSTKRRAWSRAPHVAILPDRFVLQGYVDGALSLNELGAAIPSPLVVGPDPQAPQQDQIRQEGDDIVVGPQMRWMVDFEEAVRVGMGFRVPLDESAFQRGFDQLMVLGVRLESDEEDGRKRFEELLDNHHRGRAGLSLIPQGTPTNNTEDGGSGYSGRDDPDLGFDLVKSGGFVPNAAAHWFERADGQWLADWLGVSSELFRLVHHADRSDVSDAQAMNVALWPATLGYTMDTMLSSVFDDAAVGFTRNFFTQFVSGRGMTPALRIGPQPYGILPAVAYSRMSFAGRFPEGPIGLPGDFAQGLTKLHEILMGAHAKWGELLARVAQVGKSGDPHQILLDVLGLHPTSVEHYTRLAQSLEQVINSMALHGFAGFIERIIAQLTLLAQGTEILAAHGYDVAARGRPDLLDKFFRRTPTPIAGALIDDEPLSETAPLRAQTTDDRNYLAWLADTARVSLETIRREEGFGDAGAPRALLYMLLRHALLLGYYETGVRLYARAGVLSGAALVAARTEANFVHVADQPQPAESRYKLLYQPEPAVTGGDPTLLVGELIPQLLFGDSAAAPLSTMIAAIDRLQNLATARLERILVEHLDVCTYRLDAWLQGLVHYQLTRMRFPRADLASPRRGLYLGAYGWLENVKPDPGARESVVLEDAGLREIFTPAGATPLEIDPQNAGYVHTPSLNQAVTAAVLRNGYLTNATPQEPGPFAVNLSSERVRRAMAILEGMQNGQSLGALLGYQLERGLHDRHGEAEVDEFIYQLRKQFPLRADRINDTASAADAPIQTVEARNVLDGVALVDHIEKERVTEYPFNISTLPPASPSQAAAINAEVARLLDTNDAVADLGIAEGIHQVVQGNYDRAAASLDAFGKAQLPPRPDIVETPRSGTGLTHRVGLHLTPGLDPDDSPHATIDPTPRSRAEPALNQWLASMLPLPEDVAVVVRLSDGTGFADTRTITQAALNLQSLDLLFLLRTDSEQAMSALDDRITLHVQGAIRPDGEIEIVYTERIPGKVSLFELSALTSELRSLVSAARPLRATDLALPIETKAAGASLAEFQVERLSRVRTDMAAPLEALRTLHGELTALLADPEANEIDLLDGIDDHVDRLVEFLAGLEEYGLPQTGFGFALAWRRERYRVLLRKLADLDARWQERLDRFGVELDAYDNLPPAAVDELRFEQLLALEKIVTMVTTQSSHSSPVAYRTAILDSRDVFAQKKAAFAAIAATSTQQLSVLLDVVLTEAADLQQFDFVRLDLDADIAEIVRFSGEAAGLAGTLIEDIDERRSTAAMSLAAYPAASTDAARAEAATTAAHALLGDDFMIVPEFVLPPPAADELAKAHAARATLLAHLQSSEAVDFPVDDWLYGMARVRAQMGHWESVTMLAEALVGIDPDLHPLQLPYRDDDSWLALQHPADYAFDGDRLLYTAHYATAFAKDAQQCGLLLDEWTEVIPAREETTGIAFHYDRPNAEPPQVMMLAVPPALGGRWQWQDLVDAVRETMELARRRAVEPDHVDSTSYGRFVPATVSATTVHPITIALNLAVNNPEFRYVDPGSGNA